MEVLPDEGWMSASFLLLVDEMYLRKRVQYHCGHSFKTDNEETLYKGVAVFMFLFLLHVLQNPYQQLQ